MRSRQTPFAHLTPHAYYTLAALAGLDESHAYHVCQKVAELSGQSVIMEPGTMSHLLRRLIRHQFIEPTIQDGNRQYYCITASGRRQLDQELTRLKRAVVVGEQAKMANERSKQGHNLTFGTLVI